jgi:hypothetical protein
MAIAPGRTSTIQLQFMMHDGMAGQHDFVMQLKTNDPTNPITQLEVKSNWVP